MEHKEVGSYAYILELADQLPQKNIAYRALSYEWIIFNYYPYSLL